MLPVGRLGVKKTRGKGNNPRRFALVVGSSVTEGKQGACR
jgi:hypothetical protein